MPRRQKPHRKYRLKIGAFTPATIPMLRLAEYMEDFALLLGNEKSVHPGALEQGSTVLVANVEWEAEPKVRSQLLKIRESQAEARVMEAAARLDNRLAEDNAKGTILDPHRAAVIEFPGRERFQAPVFGPIQQQNTLQGVPIKVGGENDPVPVHLEDGAHRYIVHAKRSLAKEIAQHLFVDTIRVYGSGRWTRNADGAWQMSWFLVDRIEVLETGDLRRAVGELRSIDSAWKLLKDPLKHLEQIRRGAK